MVLQKINRSTIEQMHRQGAFKKVGTVKLTSGEKLSGAKLRDYMVEKSRRYGSVGSLTEAVGKETAKSQWRQRAELTKVLQESVRGVATKNSEQPTPSAVSRGWFGFGARKEEKKPIRRDMIRAGRVNMRGEYEEDAISNRPGMIGSQQKNSSIGIGSRSEQGKNATTGIASSRNRNAIGIGGNESRGFSTIGSITNKK